MTPKKNEVQRNKNKKGNLENAVYYYPQKSTKKHVALIVNIHIISYASKLPQ
ncbi:MAG: hypothetical protein VB027_02340 [Gordonibacter sp.]|nr:hypothetical protein [Gordonibacter sp.]